MKSISRRNFFAVSGGLMGTALAPKPVQASSGDSNYDEANAKLYDATRCIGCRACEKRCKEYNELDPPTAEHNGQTYYMPQDLSVNNFMILEAYEGKDQNSDGRPDQWSFIKKNCMHCNRPSCETACPVAALVKTPEGPVIYDESVCIGCRYCELACPYEVVRYEYHKLAPRVRKCTLCMECVDVCPTGALKQGKRADLIAEAHRRIKQDPDKYVDHVYGEHEAGGGSYLILSGVEFEKLGLPSLPDHTNTSYADTIMNALPGWVVGFGLFLGALNKLKHRQEHHDEEDACTEEGGHS